MASQRGDYYQGLFLGKDENIDERIIVNFRFPEKNKTVNATWWFDSSIESHDYFFKNFFGTELKDIIIFRNGKSVSLIKPLKESFPLEFELTFDVKILKKPKIVKAPELSYRQKKWLEMKAKRDALIQQELNKHWIFF